MRNKEFVNIDTVIKRAATNISLDYEGDYADFLTRLNKHGHRSIVLDELLTNKFQKVVLEEPFTWKRIVAIIWFRRIRNFSLVVLALIGLGSGLLWFSKDKSTPAFVEEVNSVERLLPTIKKYKTESRIKIEKLVPNAIEKGDEISNKVNVNKSLLSNQLAGIEFQVARTSQQLVNTTEPFLTKRQFKIPVLAVIKNSEELGPIIGATQLKKVIKRNKESHNFLTTGTYILGFNLIGSYQTASTSMLNNDAKNTNRNYSPLSNNGRKSTSVFNFGFSIERSLYKGFGLSLGLQKLSIRQEQKTDYNLNEVPVYDLDGSIAGYIGVPTQKINTKIVNQVDYISMPFQMIYRMKAGKKSSLKVKCGTSLIGAVNQHTEKFDYKSLDLVKYSNSANRIGLNTIQFGVFYTQYIKGNFMLSYGIERQIIAKINPLSDASEKVKSMSTNLILSLQYKL